MWIVEYVIVHSSIHDPWQQALIWTLGTLLLQVNNKNEQQLIFAYTLNQMTCQSNIFPK